MGLKKDIGDAHVNQKAFIRAVMHRTAEGGGIHAVTWTALHGAGKSWALVRAVNMYSARMMAEQRVLVIRPRWQEPTLLKSEGKLLFAALPESIDQMNHLRSLELSAVFVDGALPVGGKELLVSRLRQRVEGDRLPRVLAQVDHAFDGRNVITIETLGYPMATPGDSA